MTEKEYISQIKAIRKQIKRNPQKALGDLEELYQFKPVRQQWFIAKAEAMAKLNYPPEEIWQLLSEKFSYEPANEEVRDFFDITCGMIGDQYPVVKVRHMFFSALFTYLLEETDSSKKNVEHYDKKLNEPRNNYAESGSIDDLVALACRHYIIDNINLYLLLLIFADKASPERDFPIADWVKEQPNMGYLIERLTDSEPHTFIVVESDSGDSVDCQIAADILSKLGKRVFLLTIPVECPVENDIDIEETLSVSLENIEEDTNLTIIPSVALMQNGNWVGDNRDHIINHITENLSEDRLATVLCSGNMFDELEWRPSLQKKFQRLTPFKSNYLNRNMEFGWTGDYLSYISRIYEIDVHAEISRTAECDFSIIIPARNSAASLRYTLQTCLNQRFSGSYEIVLSDNSTGGNAEVYNLFCELNDERIKYYKTPRDLPLSKSFEFAFLKSRGRFIFSLGSDDGVLPWALEALNEVLKQLPQDEIVMWDRGFYAWPGFNKGQQNQFVIPGDYQKGDVKLQRGSGKKFLDQIISNPNLMYLLPMLYINSGFKRSYIRTLLEKTGRLWDGVCQDIYMGVVSLSINDTFPIIKYPLTIAGMTNSSIGASSNKAITENNDIAQWQEQRLKTSNIGGYAASSTERLLPPYDTDRSSLYRSVLRAVARGLQPPELLDRLDWKKIFSFLAQQLSIDDIQIERKLHWLKYSASLINEETAKYVEKEICSKAFIPRIIEKPEDDGRKLYQEGPIAGGGQTLDASKYGVSNIYEAAQLFEKLTGL